SAIASFKSVVAVMDSGKTVFSKYLLFVWWLFISFTSIIPLGRDQIFTSCPFSASTLDNAIPQDPAPKTATLLFFGSSTKILLNVNDFYLSLIFFVVSHFFLCKFLFITHRIHINVKF